jgi:hypothetical protein
MVATSFDRRGFVAGVTMFLNDSDLPAILRAFTVSRAFASEPFFCGKRGSVLSCIPELVLIVLIVLLPMLK